MPTFSRKHTEVTTTCNATHPENDLTTGRTDLPQLKNKEKDTVKRVVWKEM